MCVCVCVCVCVYYIGGIFIEGYREQFLGRLCDQRKSIHITEIYVTESESSKLQICQNEYVFTHAYITYIKD